MRRIVIVGCPGAGKTALASELAQSLGLTHIEMDGLFHEPNWQQASVEQFQSRLGNALDEADNSTDGWTTCGNYNDYSAGIHTARADALIWLDLPKALIIRRVTTRTLTRAVRREELWNGNREPLTNLYRWDPDKNIIRWVWTTYDSYRERYERYKTDGTWAHLTVHRLAHPARSSASSTGSQGDVSAVTTPAAGVPGEGEVIARRLPVVPIEA